MTIYIATNEHGRGVKHISGFESRKDFLSYAYEVLSRSNASSLLRSNSTIEQICEALYDAGIGYGSRSHFRIWYNEAKKLRNTGIKFNSCWKI